MTGADQEVKIYIDLMVEHVNLDRDQLVPSQRRHGMIYKENFGIGLRMITN